MKKHAGIVIISVLLVLLFFAGCKTVPSAADMADPVDFLPDDADIYFRMNSMQNKSLLKAVVEKAMPYMAESDIQKLADCIHVVYVSQNSDTKQMCVVASGSFPSFKSLAFTAKNGWTEYPCNITSPIKYKYTKYVHVSGMEVAFPTKDLVFFSPTSIDSMQSKLMNCLINGSIEHNDLLSDNVSADIAFHITEPRMNTLGLSVLDSIIGNVSIVQGSAVTVPLSETVAENSGRAYSVNCMVELKEKRAAIPVRLLLSKAFNTEAEITEDGVIVLQDFLIKEDKLISYFIGG